MAKLDASAVSKECRSPPEGALYRDARQLLISLIWMLAFWNRSVEICHRLPFRMLADIENISGCFIRVIIPFECLQIFFQVRAHPRICTAHKILACLLRRPSGSRPSKRHRTCCRPLTPTPWCFDLSGSRISTCRPKQLGPTTKFPKM
jgi:hypothetical protein